MRIPWIAAVALGGCGFHITGSGSTANDANGSDDADVGMDADIRDATDADIVPMIDAPMVDAPFMSSDCPTSYIAVGNLTSRYRVISTNGDPVTQFNACNDVGTHLAVVDTQAEADALRQFIDGITNLPSSGALGVFVYIGGVQDPAATSKAAGWVSATGAFNGAFWENGEPNDNPGGEDGDEQFAAIWRLHNLIADVPKTSLPALCECDGLPITTEYKTFLTSNDQNQQ